VPKRKPGSSTPSAAPAGPASRGAAAIIRKLGRLYPAHPLAVTPRDSFQVLVATMLSSRTKDPVTNAAMARLWPKARTPQAILKLPEATLAGLLKPVGFYQTKAAQLHGLCRMLLAEFAGAVPPTRDELMRLPGVGRKVANLVLNICFDVPAICVDTHVHRIANRLGWVATATPEQTEAALMHVVPQALWATVNRVLVNYGQQVCHPTSPHCSTCAIADACQRIGVERSR
jgi:endonuclease-3